MVQLYSCFRKGWSANYSCLRKGWSTDHIHALLLDGIVSCMIILQGCRQGGGAEAVPDVKLMLYCVQVVTTKGHPKFREEKQLSGYKLC